MMGADLSGPAYFPDFYKSKDHTVKWWHDCWDNFKKFGLEFDGVWLNYNEVTSLCDGYCPD